MNNYANPWQSLGINTKIDTSTHHVGSIIQEILQNLRFLLNTRQRHLAGLEQEQAKSRTLSFGLADLSQFNPESEKQRRSLCEALQICISQHEPRLKQVQIDWLDPTNQFPFELHFRINGLLQLPKPPRFIQLESVLNLEQQRFEISDEGLAYE